MASGASARTLLSLLFCGGLALLVVAAPASAGVGPRCAGEIATIPGTPGNDTLTGTSGDDVIRAGAGNDTIDAGNGDDIICAGPGDDTTSAGAGNDRVRSGSGNDQSNGDEGDDDMRGQGNNDSADGGTGIDRCLFETHQECEADLELTMTGPAAATTGSLTPSVYRATLDNHGPTPAVNTRIDVTLPPASVFIPASSDSRCSATSATNVRCVLGAMGLDLPDSANIGIAFTACNPSSQVIAGVPEDPVTNDQVPANNPASVSTALSIAAACLPTAVNDAATVNHDSGANPIDVLANDIPGTLPFSIGSVTDGAHGTVAITNGGANVSYTPSAGYCGPDSFTYQLTPGGSQATVTVNVLCPTAVADQVDYFCFGDQTIDVLANDLNPGGGPIKVIAVTQGAHGTVTITNGGADLQYSGDFNNDTFTYTITGGSTATVTLNTLCE